MSTEVRVPALPESVADATILAWHKQAGDRVSRDDKLLDLETDKVVLEVPAPTDGILGSHRFKVGDTVIANDLLATIEAGGAKVPAGPPAKAAAAEPALAPAVRRLIKEHNLDPSIIQGTGKEGRILKSDVLSYLDSQQQPQAPAIEEAPAPAPQTAPTPTPSTGGERPEQRVPMTRLRARVAERLLQAQQQAAILTTFNEVNLQAVMDLRKRHQESFEKTHGVRLGLMSFFVKAATEALKKFPVVNASVDGNDIIYHGYFDIGVAVGSSRGLVVPILRDTDQLGFADIEKDIRAFGQKAEEGSLSLEELTGGTFTISNGGVYGSMLSTPILNPPQSAILGMHNIQQRPVAENGEVVIRPMMYLALSYDHRIIDGREAVQFLVNIKENLEDPARLMLKL
jgi:2-oxoglutarate dehydrogenase E2 component (dihydrolipoamide succinyltransferase)